MREIYIPIKAETLIATGIQSAKPISIFIFLLFVFVQRSHSASQTINDRTKLYTLETTRDSLLLKIDNSFAVPVSVRVDFELENLQGDSTFRRSAIVPGNTSGFILARFKKIDHAKPYRCSYQWKIVLGDVSKVPDAKYVYDYPFPKGHNYKVSQGPHGEISHKDMYAFDFAMPVGTPVTAAREGIVALTKSDSRLGGPDRKFLDAANFVSVYHSDGTIATYLHLNTSGVLVKEGEIVKKGQVLGYSGNTGFSSGPHLHFEVTQTGADFAINKWIAFNWETRPDRLLTSLLKINFVELLSERKL